MIWALDLYLLMELNEESPSSLHFDLPLETYKLKILLKPRDRTKERRSSLMKQEFCINV
jgi:hypothetical protein